MIYAESVYLLYTLVNLNLYFLGEKLALYKFKLNIFELLQDTTNALISQKILNYVKWQNAKQGSII